MGQYTASGAQVATAQKAYTNVGEAWNLYDTILCGGYTASMDFNTGWFTTFALLGAANSLPFFSVRNKNHGLMYNNQDTRDQLAYVFRVFTMGVSFFAPSVPLYEDTAGTPDYPQTQALHHFVHELPKHCSATLQIQQDERLKINCLMTPPGYGAIGGGVAQGDPEVAWAGGGAPPNVARWNTHIGMPELTNRWAFPEPLEIPRRANLSVTLRFSEYGRQLLQDMPGPNNLVFANSDSTAWQFKYGMVGIQVVLGGQRLVQQRGQAHA